MNFLKISGLVIGAGSVVGGTGAGIYYGITNYDKIDNLDLELNKKTQFHGKLVFYKKTDSSSFISVAKLLKTSEYNSELSTFNKDKQDENQKYENINKIIEISHLLNVEETIKKLNEIFVTQTTFQEVKTTITDQEEVLKDLFGSETYEKLKEKFNTLT